VGIPAGVAAALYKNRWIDWSVMLLAMVGICVPAFVLAPLFGMILGSLPGLSVAGWDNPACMVLPALTLGLINAAYLARLARGGMLETLSMDYIRTAKAKGASPWRMVVKHALRGGLLPAISYLGPAFAALITGSFVVETCFQVPGMGQHFVNATTDRDYFLIQGLVLFYGLLIVLANLAVDLIQVAINPRLRSAA
jgi:oligopeptide transport system permease protein